MLRAQRDLVKVTRVLRPVLYYKGTLSLSQQCDIGERGARSDRKSSVNRIFSC